PFCAYSVSTSSVMDCAITSTRAAENDGPSPDSPRARSCALPEGAQKKPAPTQVKADHIIMRKETAVIDDVLVVKGLSTWFATDDGDTRVVEDISFSIGRGEVFGLVGESGSGKSVTSRSIIRLLPEDGSTAYEGEILFQGTDVLSLNASRMRALRCNEIAMVFQDPMSALNPVYTIGDQVMESILTHNSVSATKAREMAIETLEAVGYPS